ncbi:MAG: DUF4129 domain-containing protein, partial [Anaerolineales bacterium]|nr:DUF4129 domain-containing protein [Anaerolineales bacterium]
MGIVHLNWRKEALYMTLAAAEMCWFTPWALVITHRAEVAAPYGTALTLGILVLAVMYFSRIMDRLQLDLLYQRVILVIAVVITSALIMHFLLYPSYSLLDLDWLGKAGGSLLYFYSLPPEAGVAAIVLFLWWRGISIGQRNLTFQGVAFSFRLGILVLIFSTLLLSISVAYDSTVFILPFFFFSLMAVALARVEEVNQAKGGVGAPFNFTWLAILLGSIVVVLVTAWLISRVYSIEGFSQVLRWLQPVVNPLLRVVEYVFILLIRLLEPLLRWFFRIFQGIVENLPQNIEGLENFGPLPTPDIPSAEPTQPPRWLIDVSRYVCLSLTGAGILAALALTLRRRLERQRRGDEIRESLWSSAAFADGMLNSLRDGWDRLKDLAGLVGRFGPGMRLYAAVSIRKIYANMARLAERQGFPRQPAQTPYEYLPALGLAFPDCQTEAAAITEAYVKVHYGEVPES